MDENTILSGESITLRDALIGTWNGDGTYSQVTRVYGPDNITVTVTGISAQRQASGGQILASYGATTGTEIEFTWAGDWTSLGVLLGVNVETYGTSPEQIRAFEFNPRVLPHFGLIAGFSTDDGKDNAVQFFAPKCALTPESFALLTQSGNQEAEYSTITLTAQILPDDNYYTGGLNTVVLLTLGSPEAGTYKLAYGPHVTTALAYGANAAAIEDALELLPNIGVGNVTVAAATPAGFNITFTGDLAEGSWPPIRWVDDDIAFDGTLTTSRVQIGKKGTVFTWKTFELEGAYDLSLPPNYAIEAP